MTANNDPIGKALNLTPLVPVKPDPVAGLLDNALNDSAKSDFEVARTNLHTAINTGIDALSTLSQIAESSQQPRAYEVVAKLIDSIAQASKDLMELQTNIRAIDTADKPVNGNVTNNNLFVGSTAELQRILQQIKNGS